MSKQTQTVISTPQTTPVPASQSFNLSQSIQSLKNKVSSFKQSVVSSQTYKTCDSNCQTFGQQFCKPLSNAWKHTYTDLPQQTTKLKFNYLHDYSFKERFVFLNVLALGGALLTMRGLAGANLWGKSFRAMRNASLAYIFGGLLVAPQIYNPLMKQ